MNNNNKICVASLPSLRKLCRVRSTEGCAVV